MFLSYAEPGANFMRRWMMPIGVAALVFAASSWPARAEGGVNLDDVNLAWLAKQRAEHGGWGIAIIDVVIMVGSARCDHPKLSMTTVLPDGKKIPAAVSGFDPSLLGAGYGGAARMPAGEYVVEAAECQIFNTRKVLNGRQARFQVREGEAVNVGRYKLVHKDGGFFSQLGNTPRTVERSVEPLPPNTVAWLNQKVPRLYAMAPYRPMKLEGPVAGAVQRQ
jgi:hypothetical protein